MSKPKVKLTKINSNLIQFKEDLFNALEGTHESSHTLNEMLEEKAREMITDYLHFESEDIKK